jgi:hypothetical protein
MDFGWTRFAAFVECWWDRDMDVFYLVRTLRLREQTPLQHSLSCDRGICVGHGRMTGATQPLPAPAFR